MKYLMKVRSIEELIAYNNAIDDSNFLDNVASSSEIANALSTVFTSSEIINNPKKLNRMSFVKAFIQKKGM